jgi:hypothetical protein
MSRKGYRHILGPHTSRAPLLAYVDGETNRMATRGAGECRVEPYLQHD